jgi:hypothetical protein
MRMGSVRNTASRGLKEIGRQIQAAEGMRARVGILGSKTDRRMKGTTNAEVGFIHEVGAPAKNIPQRSWLRMPLCLKSKEILKEAMAGAVGLMAAGKIKLMYQRLGIAAENAIQAAFDTGGFGSWAPLKYRTLMAKIRKGPIKHLNMRKQQVSEQMEEGARHTSILIDTAQLRRSVSSKVVTA